MPITAKVVKYIVDNHCTGYLLFSNSLSKDRFQAITTNTRQRSNTQYDFNNPDIDLPDSAYVSHRLQKSSSFFVPSLDFMTQEMIAQDQEYSNN